MRLIAIIAVLFLFVSSVTSAQLRRETKSVYFLTGMDAVPTVEGNGSMTTGGVKPFAGVGVSMKIDAIYVDGSISYLFADSKLFTVGGRILFETPFKVGAVKRPLLVGPSYKMYISKWEIHSLNLHLAYMLTETFTIYGEGGFATYSLKEGNVTEPTAQLGVKIGAWWK